MAVLIWIIGGMMRRNSAKRRIRDESDRAEMLRSDLLDYLAYHCYKDVVILGKYRSESEWVKKTRTNYINSFTDSPYGKGAMARNRLSMYKFAEEYDGGRDWRSQMKKSDGGTK